jgi:metallophosphoesterase (TIGR00282 family)
MRNRKDCLRVIFIGDIVGKYGRRMLRKSIEKIRYKYKPDLIIANGENSAGGLGIVKKTAEQLFEIGIDLISTGNHIWDKRKESVELLENEPRVIRPLNFPQDTPGKGCVKIKINDEVEFVLINLQGRVFMEPVTDNPFNAIEKFLEEDGSRAENRIIFVDFHAEATAEKQAMGYMLDGRVSAVLCTHTHIQTSDLRILSEGTAFQSDVGMTGTLDSIIGMDKYPIIQKFKDGMNRRFEVVNGVQILEMSILDIDYKTAQTVDCEYVRLYENKL